MIRKSLNLLVNVRNNLWGNLWGVLLRSWGGISQGEDGEKNLEIFSLR